MFRSHSTSTVAIFAFFVLGLFWFLNPFPSPRLPPSQSTMAVKHLVLFQFKADTSAEKVAEACSRMLGLRDGCVHPTSQKPYIRSLTGGKDNSKEGLQSNITHAFVVEFASVEDRDYYVNTDPAHRDFVAFIGPIAEKAVIVDYAEGEF